MQLSAQPLRPTRAAAASFCIAMIWRPEVIKNADPKSLCRLSCTSKTLRSDLQGIRAWARLAEAQYPPPTPRNDDEARSHVRRREVTKHSPPTLRVLEGLTLQQAIARETPAPVAFTPDEFSDFTFFLRLEGHTNFMGGYENARLCWEGDLGELSRQSDERGLVLHLSLRHANLKWPWAQADIDYLERVRITLVAIRDEDQAMVSLGRWNCFEVYNGGRQYEFLPRSDLEFISSSRSHLELKTILCVTQDGYVDGLDLRLQHDIHDPQPDAPTLYEREDLIDSNAAMSLGFGTCSATSPAFTTPPRAHLPWRPSRAGSWRPSGRRAGPFRSNC